MMKLLCPHSAAFSCPYLREIWMCLREYIKETNVKSKDHNIVKIKQLTKYNHVTVN